MRHQSILFVIGTLIVIGLLGCTNNETSAKSQKGEHLEKNPQKQNPIVLINLFEVPVETEESFITEWKGAADYLRQQEGFISTALRKSLNPQARFRYVNIAVWKSPEAFKNATNSKAFQPIRVKIKETKAQGTPSLYTIVPIPEEKNPAKFHAQYLAQDIVFLINPFEDIPSNVNDEFINGWHAAESYLKQQKGYVDTALHQSLSANTPFRFVNVAIWDSAKAFQAAVSDQEFQKIGNKIPYNAYPSLYTVNAQ